MNIEMIYDEGLNDDPASGIFGIIKFSNNTGTIVEKETFLDSWLFALVEALPKLETGEDCLIDLVDEPTPVEIRREYSGFRFSYDRKDLTFQTTSELRDPLTRACSELISQIEDKSEIQNSDTLPTIASFAE